MILNRIFKAPEQSFFLMGPRGSGKYYSGDGRSQGHPRYEFDSFSPGEPDVKGEAGGAGDSPAPFSPPSHPYITWTSWASFWCLLISDDPASFQYIRSRNCLSFPPFFITSFLRFEV